MPEQAEDMIVRNLIEALEPAAPRSRSRRIVDGGVACFQHPAPEYQPGNDYLLPTLQAAGRAPNSMRRANGTFRRPIAVDKRAPISTLISAAEFGRREASN